MHIGIKLIISKQCRSTLQFKIPRQCLFDGPIIIFVGSSMLVNTIHFHLKGHCGKVAVLSQLIRANYEL